MRRDSAERPWSAGSGYDQGRGPRTDARREGAGGSRQRIADRDETWPELPDWVDPRELGTDVLRDLRGLSAQSAEFVAGHLVAAGALADDEPELAWRHARAARSRGGRVAVVRETVGLVAYRAGEWAEAIAELRAARRIAGGPGQLPVIADAERALGRPDRAIALSRTAEATELDPAAAAELRIVVAGARMDLGDPQAALAGLASAVHDVPSEAPYRARLFYAYADAVLADGRRAEALDWFVRAADADEDEETDATDRIDELTADDPADRDEAEDRADPDVADARTDDTDGEPVDD